MSKESYARGFCKAAKAAGVDPVVLAKYAQGYDFGEVGPTRTNAIIDRANEIGPDKVSDVLADEQWIPRYWPRFLRHDIANRQLYDHVMAQMRKYFK